MAGSIPPLRPRSSASPSDEKVSPAAPSKFVAGNGVTDAAQGEANLPSMRKRLLERLGWNASAREDRTATSRFAQTAALTATKPAKPHGILKMLNQNQHGANIPEGTEAPGARSWKSLVQTSIGLEFERTVANLSRQKTHELTVLQAGIDRLPAEQSAHYQALLSDILAYGNPTERDTMLADLGRDVAARLKMDP